MYKYLAFFLLAGCVSKSEVQADIFLHEQLPAEICEKNPELAHKGIYRIVDCDKAHQDSGICQIGGTYKQRLSYCRPEIENYWGANKADAQMWLDLVYPPSKK